MAERKPVQLFTAGTPNGQKVSIMLEELGLPYTVKAIDLKALEQKEEWFLKINPNGRIPAIVDGEDTIFESGAILIYLAEKEGKFLPPIGDKKRHQVIEWVMFQMSGIGPMQGQANWFIRSAPEKTEYAIKRYQDETIRLYKVLEKQLEGREYLVDEVSIADFATFTWVNVRHYAQIETPESTFPNLLRWIQTMASRPGVQRGLKVPEPKT